MKKSVLIFMEISLIIIMLGLLVFSGAIYDAEEKSNIDTFFFEPGLRPDQRISTIVAANNIPNDVLRKMIIDRFVNEYFYVIPYSKNAYSRSELVNTDTKPTTLVGLSWNYPIVWQKWQETVAPEIVDLATNRALRFVDVRKISEAESGHLIVDYELKTWTQPNNILEKPEIKKGTMYIDVETKGPIEVKQTQRNVEHLREGQDPVSAFKFEIKNVEQN